MTALVWLVAAINFLAAWLQAATGFGYAILAMFLLPRLLPYRQCSVITAAMVVVIALQMSWQLRGHIRLRKVAAPLAWCLATLWIGIWLIGALDELVLRRIMGVFLILLAVFFWLTQRPGWRLRHTRANSAIFGALTGLATGMFNITGPFFTVYYYHVLDDSLEVKANLEFSFLIAGSVSLILNLRYVQLDGFMLQAIGLSALAALGAGVAGLPFYRRIDKAQLQRIILVVLPVLGALQLVR